MLWSSNSYEAGAAPPHRSGVAPEPIIRRMDALKGTVAALENFLQRVAPPGEHLSEQEGNQTLNEAV